MRIFVLSVCLLASAFVSPAWAQLDWLGSYYINQCQMDPEIESTVSPFPVGSDLVFDDGHDFTLTDHTTVRTENNNGYVASGLLDANNYTNHQNWMETNASPSQNKVTASSWIDVYNARSNGTKINRWDFRAYSCSVANIKNTSGGWRKVKITYVGHFGAANTHHDIFHPTPMLRMDYKTPQVTGYFKCQMGYDIDDSSWNALDYVTSGQRHNAYGAMDAGTSSFTYTAGGNAEVVTITKHAIVYLAPDEVLEISASVNGDGFCLGNVSPIAVGNYGTGTLPFNEKERTDWVEAYCTDLGAVTFPGGVANDYDNGSTSGTLSEPSGYGTQEP